MNRRTILSLFAAALLPIPAASILLREEGCVDCGITCEEAPGLPFYAADKNTGERRDICDPCFNIARKNGSLSRFRGYRACEMCGLLGSGGVYFDKTTGRDYTCWDCYEHQKSS